MTHSVATLVAAARTAPIRAVTLRVGAFGIDHLAGIDGQLIVRRDIGTAYRAWVARTDLVALRDAFRAAGVAVRVVRS